MSDLQKKIAISRLPPMPPSGLGRATGTNKQIRGRGRKDYSPTAWDQYYDLKKDIKIDDENTFRLYECGVLGPVCLFLHGGGFSALSWALLSSECVSWNYFDRDVADVIRAYYGDDPPPIILVGHSMGGAIAVHVAHRKLIPSLIGLAVIDVVEGTALDALTSMPSFLRGRPQQFKSLEHAIEYCVRSGAVRNLESAKVSMVGQLKRIGSNETETDHIQHNDGSETQAGTHTIMEEDEETSDLSSPGKAQFQQPAEPGTSTEKYTWRINLSRTEKHWKGWFEGLSRLFLSCEVPKMLFLAGVDRLDKELSIGQMQGKFQMHVLPQCGHVVHEDVPDKVADVLATFMLRHKVTDAKQSY